MKLLTAGLITSVFALPTSAFAQGAAENTYGGSGQVPAAVGPTVLGVTEVESGQAGVQSGSGQAPTQSGTAGVQQSGGPGGPGGAPQVAATTPAASVPSGSLPFTGLDLALIALGGAALLAAGLAMRRFGRPVASS